MTGNAGCRIREAVSQRHSRGQVPNSCLGSSCKCNTLALLGIGCRDGETKQAPQQRGPWRDFGRGWALLQNSDWRGFTL